MTRSVLNIPLILGRKDSIDPKFAPLGVVAVAKNQRVRADGRLACRNGYAALTMTSSTGTVAAFDLHEYQGRLLALASDTGDASPADVFELVNSDFVWRASDSARNQTLCPFTNPRETAGISQVGSGISYVSGAVGGGFSAMIWRVIGTFDLFLAVYRQLDGQCILHQRVSTTVINAQICFSVDSFYIQQNVNGGDLVIVSFKPGTDSAVQAYATTLVGGGSAGTHDIVAVTNPSTARVVSGLSKGGTTTIKVFNSAGAQVGATATVAQTAIFMSLDADQTDNTINLYSVVAANTGQIRTFNLTTGALTLGPTATTAGVSGSSCRLPTLGANVQAIAVAVNDASSNVVIQTFSQSAHGALATFTVQKALLRSKLVNGQSGTQKRAVVFSGIVAPALPAVTDPTTSSTTATAAIFYASPTVAHMSTRDTSNAIDPTENLSTGTFPNLSLDASTKRLGWVTSRNSSVAIVQRSLSQPAFTLLDFLSSERRQGAQYGALAYFTGATVQAYDGLFPTELNFNEIPGIYSATPLNGGGALAPGATYTYIHHWEYTRADGSVEQSAPSTPLSVTLGAADNAVNVLVSNPHSIRIALGATLFGGTVVSVLSRTVWNTLTGTQGSQFRRCVVKSLTSGMANYGTTITVGDLVSDVSLAKQGVVYTQGARGEFSGPLQHDAPEGCSFISASSARLVIAGMARSFEFEESKAARLDEPINFSEFSSFFGKISKAAVGVLSLDGVRLIFSRDVVYSVIGEGANDIGGNALPPPVEVASPSGLKDWRSLLKDPRGVYFQLDTDKLYQIPRGGSSPNWAGVDIKDTLASFPTITGACLHRRDDVAAFSCNNVAANDARIIVRSMRTGIWTEDTPPLQASSGIAALAALGDSIAYISGGVVYQQSTTTFADPGSAVITTQTKTHPIYPFGLGGYGELEDLLVVGEFRSAGTLALRVSIDEGITFVPYDSFVITGLTVGATFRKRWALQQADANSGIFEFTFTPSAVGEGVILHAAALLSNSEPGKLIELDPADCA